MDSPLYGIVRSEETRRKLSLARKGNGGWWLGKKRSLDQRLHMSKIVKKRGYWKGENNPRHINPLKGKDNPNWQGGITPINAKLRNSKEYLDWKVSVFKRDDCTCQCCGSKKNLEAHHIENFSSNEEKRSDISNGISMCGKCHNPIHKGSFHNIYGTYDNNLDQLQEYFIGVSWDINLKRQINDDKEVNGDVKSII